MFAGLTGSALAAAPAAAVAAASEAVPVVKEGAGFLEDVAAVPMAAGQILYLPMGMLECVFFPLPGVSFGSGLEHIGTGIIAPFKFVLAVVSLPYHAVVAVDNTCDRVVPAAK